MSRTLLAAFLLALCASAYADFSLIATLNGTGTSSSGTQQFMFSEPGGVLAAEGKLYVADSSRATLTVFDAATLDRLAAYVGARGASDPSFSFPLHMAYESGTVYVADTSDARIKSYSGTGSQIDNWNPASNLLRPTSLAITPQYFYITDSGRGQVVAYSRATRSYASIVIDAGGSDGRLSTPQDIEHYEGKYYVSDSGKKLVFVYDENFTYLFAIGRGLGGVSLVSPRGIDVEDGRLYVADTSANRVVEFALDGYPVSILDSSTTPDSNLSYPEDVSASGGKLYVTDTLHKLVKVFSINGTSGNNTLQQLMLSANESVRSLSEAKQVAAMLGLQVPQDGIESDLALAQDNYDHFQYTSASLLAQKVLDSARAAEANLSQSIDVKARQLVKESADRVAPYRPRAQGSSAVLLTQFDNTIADVNSKLSARAYLQAANLSLSLPTLADSIIDAIDGNAAKEEQASRERMRAETEAQIGIAEARLSNLEGKLAAYRQEITTAPYTERLQEARAQLSAGEFEEANRTATSLIGEIASQDGYLSQVAGNIDDARGNISAIEALFNQTASKGTLFPADLAPERSQLAAAYDTSYSNQALSIAMAQQALDSAEAKVKDAQSLSIAAAAILIMLALMAIMGGAFAYHIRGRRRRQAEAALREEKRLARKRAREARMRR